MIELKDIDKEYPPYKILFKNSLTVHNGEYVAIMGPSGSGKTTLMNIIGLLDRPTAGQYLLNGEDISLVSENQRAHIRNKTIGFVFQQFNLLAKLTAIDNVALPLLYQKMPRQKRLEKARQALAEVGLSGKENFYPNQLSGGQCQRVAIARAMVCEPEILLADEPTGALDSQNGHLIMELFEKINREKKTSIILITHDRDVANYANIQYLMKDGHLTSLEEQV